MNKSELNKRIERKFYRVFRKSVNNVSEIMLEHLSENLSMKKRIEIRGFGSFFIKKYRDWKRINPKTGESFIKSDGFRVRFKVSNRIKQKLLNKEV